MRTLCLIIFLSFLVPRAAAAQSAIWQEHSVVEEPHSEPPPKPSPWRRRRFALHLHLGIAMPYGGIGLAAEYSFVPALSLEGGVGASGSGPQLASLVHLRLPTSSGRAPFLAVGYSQGPHEQTPLNRFGAFSPFLAPMASMDHGSGERRGHRWTTARWLNVESGYEHRRHSGGGFRAYGGVAQILNVAQAITSGPETSDQRVEQLSAQMFYVGVAFSFGFAS